MKVLSKNLHIYKCQKSTFHENYNLMDNFLELIKMNVKKKNKEIEKQKRKIMKLIPAKVRSLPHKKKKEHKETENKKKKQNMKLIL